ncbi:MAG: hypothetical protein KGJ29_15250, partial [Hyphomicrobiales bacterium]|nr:hypothetical protein [Hyphomicrobiales bacterium]
TNARQKCDTINSKYQAAAKIGNSSVFENPRHPFVKISSGAQDTIAVALGQERIFLCHLFELLQNRIARHPVRISGPPLSQL